MRLAPLNRFKPSSKSILLTVSRRCFFCGSFLLVKLHAGVCCAIVSCLFLVAVWSPAGKGLTSWLSCLLCFVTFPNMSWSTSELSETDLSPPVKYFTECSKAVLLLWIFYVFLSCVCYAFVCLFICLVVTCWERADLLALVCGVQL